MPALLQVAGGNDQNGQVLRQRCSHFLPAAMRRSPCVMVVVFNPRPPDLFFHHAGGDRSAIPQELASRADSGRILTQSEGQVNAGAGRYVQENAALRRCSTQRPLDSALHERDARSYIVADGFSTVDGTSSVTAAEAAVLHMRSRTGGGAPVPHDLAPKS